MNRSKNDKQISRAAGGGQCKSPILCEIKQTRNLAYLRPFCFHFIYPFFSLSFLHFSVIILSLLFVVPMELTYWIYMVELTMFTPRVGDGASRWQKFFCFLFFIFTPNTTPVGCLEISRINLFTFNHQPLFLLFWTEKNQSQICVRYLQFHCLRSPVFFFVCVCARP